MSRKIRKVVASTLALAMMTGPAGSFPAIQVTQTIASAAEQAVSTTNAAGGIAGPTVDAGVYSVKAGETFSIKLKVTNNGEGFNALNSWLDVDTNVFEIVKTEAGDTDDPENGDSLAYSNVSLNTFQKDGAAAGVKTILALYSDTNNLTGDAVIATITLKAKDGVKDGNYSLAFDAKGDDGAMGNRIVTKNGERQPIVLNPTYRGAAVTVGNPSDQPQTPATQTPATQTPATQTPASQPPASSGNLTGSISNATASAGGTFSTTLSISGIDFAGFAAELNFDSSALELTKASADGFDIEIKDKSIVGLANPYKDLSSASVKLEFKASSSANGNYDVSVSSLEAASKSTEKEYKGSASKGTVTVSGGSQTPTSAPTSSNPASGAIEIEIGTVEGKPGEKVKVPVYAKNVGEGFSALQFDYDITGGLMVGRGVKGDFGCSWTVGAQEKSAQFLEADGMNITQDGMIGKLEIEIPADAVSTYEIKISNFEGSRVDSSTGKQVKLENSQFKAAAGKITVYGGTDDPVPTVASSPTVKPTSTSQSSADAVQIEIGTVEGTPGEKVKVPVYAKNVGDGFSALQFDYDITGGLKIGRGIKGDFGCSWTIGSETKSAQFLEADGMNIEKDGMIGKLEIELPANASGT